MKTLTMLIVDDEPGMNSFLEELFRRKGFTLALATSANQAFRYLDNSYFDIVITDLKLPDKDGLEVLKKVKSISPETNVIVITAYGTEKTAVNAMKLGASDYLTKPFEPEELEVVVDDIIHKCKEQITENKTIEEIKEEYDFDNIKAVSKEMAQILQTVVKVAKTDVTVLLTGESGTGKELIAKDIHYNSPRNQKRFVTVNCAAIPETLLESELFGHKKGAFTGAIQEKDGLFKVADGGTIFLDEIGSMGMGLQSKLLRVIQEREFFKVGGTSPVRVDVRVIAATNIDLKEEVEKGRFREDLYFRLNVIPIHIPPLRERKEDIIVLAEHFLKTFSQKMNKKISSITAEAKQMMMQHNWPGNVRELENMIRRAVTLEDGDKLTTKYLSITPTEIKKEKFHYIQLPPTGIKLKQTLDDIERDLILQALEQAGASQTIAARLLDLKRTTLIEKMKKYNIIDKGKK